MSEPTFIEGIGPPLEQLAEDASDCLEYAASSGDEGRNYKDILALIDEVKRLRQTNGGARETETLREALRQIAEPRCQVYPRSSCIATGSAFLCQGCIARAALAGSPEPT